MKSEIKQAVLNLLICTVVYLYIMGITIQEEVILQERDIQYHLLLVQRMKVKRELMILDKDQV